MTDGLVLLAAWGELIVLTTLLLWCILRGRAPRRARPRH